MIRADRSSRSALIDLLQLIQRLLLDSLGESSPDLLNAETDDHK